MAEETAPPAIARGTYRELRSLVWQAGLLEPRTGYYVRRITTNLLAFALGVLLFVAAGDSWWQVPIAAYLAIVTSQMAMIGHDAGHRQISRSRRANNVLGYLHLNLAAGVSHGWWNERHRKHHAHPNDPRFDPDISNSVIALWADERRPRTGRSWVSKYQAVYFFPLLFLAQGFALHFSHFKNLSKLPGRAVLIESALLAVHVAGYCSALVVTMSPLKMAAFTMVNQGIFGAYITGTVAPNHKGMPVWPEGGRTDYLQRQTATARNIRGGRVIERAFGGLNYQIEHHLFPEICHLHYPALSVIVEQVCREFDVRYFAHRNAFDALSSHYRLLRGR